jgi:hypothetical protein
MSKQNKEIFGKVALKINKDFNHEQFARYNEQLYSIIIKAMNECQKPLQAENKMLKNVLRSSDNTLITISWDGVKPIRLELEEEIERLKEQIRDLENMFENISQKGE